MQQELDAENPELNIKILGINEAGHESGNPDIINGRDLPWLQDIDDDGDGDSDTWESWNVTFRDVVITNAENEQVAVYNLTTNDLFNSDNFAALKSLLLDAATSENEPSLDLATIADVTLLAGSPLHIPLNGIDPQGQDLVFTVESDNAVVSVEVLTGNRSLRMEVDDFGAMTFELFEGRASRATQRMIELSDDGFYEDIIFHRVIDGFVIQGGDPTGTGSGGSTLGDFDDQFHVDLQHNRTGLLSTAKTTDDTNDSQFFITEGPSRHLDFNHTIFGMLVEGEDVRDQISNVAVDSGNQPVTPVVIHETDVFVDHENGVLVLSAAEGTSGSANVTVTVTDEDGNPAERTFVVTVQSDSSDGTPFLDDIAPVRMEANSVATLTLTAQDAEGDAVEFLGEDELIAINTAIAAFNSTVPPHLQRTPIPLPDVDDDLTYTVDSTTGLVTITATNGLTSGHQIKVGVRTAGSGTNNHDPTIDSQLVSVTIGVITVDAGAEAGDSTADTLKLIRNSNLTSLDILVNDTVVRSVDESLVHAVDLVGSSDDDSFIIDYSNGNVESAGGVVIRGGTQQTTAGDSLTLQTGIFFTVTHRFESASSGSVQAESNAPIVYSELEPISDSLLSGDRVFVFGDGDDEITISDDGDDTNNTSRISSSNSSETVDFRNPTGNITIRAGEGNDSVTATDIDPFASPALNIEGEEGNDDLDASALTSAVTLVGGTGDDTLTGGTADDRLNGQAGNDVVSGQTGNDSLLGGAGRDRLDGGDGNDRLLAQGNCDTLIGSGGSDLLSGGIGTDRLSASGDVDMTLTDGQLIIGGDTQTLLAVNRASLAGGPAANALDASGFTGPTTLSGAAGNDTLTGSTTADVITLLKEVVDDDQTLTDSSLTTGDGVTEIDVLANIDRARLAGGATGNRLDASAFSGPATLRGSGGDDTLIGSEQADRILGGTGSDQIEGRGGDDDVRAGAGNDTVDGGLGDDSIRAAGGDDVLDGNAGNDTLNGSFGRDTLTGGSGDDALSGLAGADDLNGGSGTDTLIAGIGPDTLRGGGGDDILLGGNGDDLVDGQGGDDTVSGNDGDDTVVEPDEVNDEFSFYEDWIDRV